MDFAFAISVTIEIASTPVIYFSEHRLKICLTWLKKGRSAKGDRHRSRKYPELVIRGEALFSSKLTNAQVLEIRRLRKEKKLKYDDLARMFNISKSAISDICFGRTWVHLLDSESITMQGTLNDDRPKLK